MIALGKSVCSDEMVDEMVFIGRPYLARIDTRYFVLTPMEMRKSGRTEIPYLEAAYFDPQSREMMCFRNLDEVAPIIWKDNND